MKAIIMAAGKGTRLKELSANCPKILIPVNGRLIIEYTFDALPREISEVIFVIGYLGEQVRSYTGDTYRGLNIKYVEQKELNGTWGALWECRDHISDNEKFIVMNGDDIYDQKEIAETLKYDLVVCYTQITPPTPKYLSVQIDQQNNISGVKSAGDMNVANIVTGVYVLDKRIFDYEPVLLSNGEYGLPQTVFNMANDMPIKAVNMKTWFSMNTKEDISAYEQSILGDLLHKDTRV